MQTARSRQTFISAVVVLVQMLCLRVSFGQEWTLTTADLKSNTMVGFRGLSADGVRVISTDSKTESVIPLDDFVSIQRPDVSDSVPSINFTLAMAGGDRLVGEPGPVVKEKLTWISPSLGKIPVPFNRLLSITRGMNASVPEETPKQDVVTLSNGDTVAGVFGDCVDLKVSMQTDNGPQTIPLETVKRIVFAAAGPAPVNNSARAFRVRLQDSTTITASSADSDGTSLTLTLPGKNAATLSVPMTKVLDIEQLNGPVSWLSSRVASENVQTPYLGGAVNWPARFDLSVDGAPLRFQGRVYDRGIGVHAYSKITYDLDPQWTVFRTQYAIDSRRDQPRRYANVTVRVLLDGVPALEEKNFREGVLSQVVTLDIKGKKTLTLECDYGADGDTQAHLDWLQPALLRIAPPAAAPASTQPADHINLPTTAPATRPATNP